MKRIALTFILILTNKCQIANKKVFNLNEKITTKDSLLVEEELKQYKNCLFSSLYNLGLQKTYKRLGINNNEISSVKDLTYFYYSGEFNPQFMIDDSNRERMFNRWINDTKYEPIPEIVDGSLDIVRALDFYNSQDLKIFLDSLRQVEYKRIINNKEKGKP
ncbi:hypothetical protein [Flavobacterium sp.]|uniref:hypothetical protein n=1 Tax=Flavobacterium sp. TaxID=239 RepID=UPI004048182A